EVDAAVHPRPVPRSHEPCDALAAQPAREALADRDAPVLLARDAPHLGKSSVHPPILTPARNSPPDRPRPPVDHPAPPTSEGLRLWRAQSLRHDGPGCAGRVRVTPRAGCERAGWRRGCASSGPKPSDMTGRASRAGAGPG